MTDDDFFEDSIIGLFSMILERPVIQVNSKHPILAWRNSESLINSLIIGRLIPDSNKVLFIAVNNHGMKPSRYTIKKLNAKPNNEPLKFTIIFSYTELDRVVIRIAKIMRSEDLALSNYYMFGISGAFWTKKAWQLCDQMMRENMQ